MKQKPKIFIIVISVGIAIVAIFFIFHGVKITKDLGETLVAYDKVNATLGSSINFEDDPNFGTLITCGVPGYLLIKECDPAHHLWIRSKGIDITGNLNGFISTDQLSGDLGVTGIVVFYEVPNAANEDINLGLSGNETLTITLLYSRSNHVQIEVATAPSTEYSGISASVVMTAYDSQNRTIAQTMKNFTGVLKNTYSTAKINVDSNQFNISHVTLHAIKYPLEGIFIKGIDFTKVKTGNSIDPPVSITVPLGVITTGNAELDKNGYLTYEDVMWLWAYSQHDGKVPVHCKPTSASSFEAHNTTKIICTATDSLGNVATNSFYAN